MINKLVYTSFDNTDITNLTPEHIDGITMNKEFKITQCGNHGEGLMVQTRPVLTTCILTLQNGFIITGHSICYFATMYNEETENTVAYTEAINQLINYEIYLLKQKEFERQEFFKNKKEDKLKPKKYLTFKDKLILYLISKL